MRIRKAMLPMAALIFAVAISVTNSPRIAGDLNEFAHETVCDSITSFSVVPPDLSIGSSNICSRDDKKSVFRSAVSYFLEKHENSPPS